MRMLTIVVVALLLSLIAGGCASFNAEKSAPPIGDYFESDGQKLHFMAYGDASSAAPPVILIHGASVNMRDMKIALGDELSKSRRVFLIDRPGRGYSTRPADGWRLEEQARLIRAAAVRAGIEKPVIVGQSFGGAVALRYALDYPDDISGLVLLAAVSHEWPGGVAWYNRVSGWPLAGFLLRRLVIPVYAPLAARKSVVASFAPDDAPQNYYDRSGLALLFRPGDFRNNAADLRHLKPQIIEMQGRYGEISVPTAIVTGADDRTVSPGIHSAALAREIPGASHQVLPETGHALHHAETATVIDAINRVSGATPTPIMRSNEAK